MRVLEARIAIHDQTLGSSFFPGPGQTFVAREQKMFQLFHARMIWLIPKKHPPNKQVEECHNLSPLNCPRLPAPPDLRSAEPSHAAAGMG